MPKIVKLELYFYCQDEKTTARDLGHLLAQSSKGHDLADWFRAKTLPDSQSWKDICFSGISYSESEVKRAGEGN